MKEKVLIIGEGMLAEAVRDRMDRSYETIVRKHIDDPIPEAVSLALVLHEAWLPRVHIRAEEVLRANGIPWLRWFVSFGNGMAGPLVLPDAAGCSQCADLRRLMAGLDRKEMWDLRLQFEMEAEPKADVAATRPGLMQLAYLIADEAGRFLRNGPVRTKEKVALTDMKTLNVSWHSFLPDPACPICGKQPADTREGARITLMKSLKARKDTYRSRTMKELEGVLARDYLDARLGFLNNKMVDLVPPFADVSVNLPLFMADEPTAGRTLSYAHSEMTAILEGLERYCGIEPRGKRTAVRGSYRDLKKEALDPLTVGVHADEQYEKPGFPFKRFDPDTVYNWVWSYSLLEEKPVLVPELLAYYSVGCGDGYVYETSNGCALGGSMEEAILYGIFEAVERDAFLLSWYAELPLPRLDPDSAEDLELSLMIDRARAAAGYDIFLYNATMEHGIPAVWALAKNRKEKGMNIICAAGAHLDPIRAAKSAIHELAGMMLTLDEKFEKQYKENEAMYRDSAKVKQMDDHGMLYGLPEAEGRLSFLLAENRPVQSFREAFSKKTNHPDLTDDLRDVLEAFRRIGLNVLVVDQTSPEIKRNGLACVKVLIPGLLPMTFGHHLTRVKGLERVLKVPEILGYTDRPLTYEELNPYPHPFP